MTIRALLAGLVATVVAADVFADNPPPVAAQPAQPAAAQPGQPGVPAAQPGQPGVVTATTVEPFRAKSLMGARISIQGGTEVGTVDDIVFGSDGQVDYLIVNNNGKLVSVPWDAAKFDLKQRVATVNITQQQFQAIPTFTVEQYPSFYTPAYRTQVYQWYNLNPQQQRRLERRFDRRD